MIDFLISLGFAIGIIMIWRTAIIFGFGWGIILFIALLTAFGALAG